MLYNIKRICFILSVFLLVGCVNDDDIDINENVVTSSSDKSAKEIYRDIFTRMSKNLDDADESFIDLKTDHEKSPYLKKAATALAVAHMSRREHILANFYLQELLKNDPKNSFGKYLLSKNQYLYAQLTQSDQQYMNSAIKSLKTNKELLKDSEYQILANTMLTRLELDKAWNNAKIGYMYKKLNKDKGYELYINRTQELGIDINSIYKR
jgi:outer membrane protein assembly factor BamD